MDIIPLIDDPSAVTFFAAAGDIIISPDEPFREVDDLTEYLLRFEDAVILTDVRNSTIEGGMFLPRLIRDAGFAHPIIGSVDLRDETESFNELKIKYLEQGGDDLLQAPVSPPLLRAVASAVLRRKSGRQHDILTAIVGPHRIMVHPNAVTVTINGQAIHLTGKEFAMILALASKPNLIITKEMFLDRLYGPLEDEPELKIIDVFVCKVRQKLANVIGKDFAAQVIETVWGRGYRWNPNPA
jgi:two-component system cell cycle response regulator CtrA